MRSGALWDALISGCELVGKGVLREPAGPQRDKVADMSAGAGSIWPASTFRRCAPGGDSS
jgi:hypothetical protein